MQTILLELVAAVDAIYRPFRGPWLTDVPAVLGECRRDYPIAGLPWLSGESTEAGRKQAQRDLEELADEGLADVIRAKGRAVGVRLTELGDQTARALAGVPNVDQSFAALLKLVDLRLAKHGVDLYGQFWIPETGYTGIPWGDPRNDSRGDNLLGKLQARLVPALARGWLDSLSSIQGHGWYSVTPEGIAAAAEPFNGQLLPALPRPHKHGYEIYSVAVHDALNKLAKQQPKSAGEIGMIPMPVSCGYR